MNEVIRLNCLFHLVRMVPSWLVQVLGHAVLASVLWNHARSVDLMSKAAITSFYMFVWKVIYWAYLMTNIHLFLHVLLQFFPWLIKQIIYKKKVGCAIFVSICGIWLYKLKNQMRNGYAVFLSFFFVYLQLFYAEYLLIPLVRWKWKNKVDA